MSKSDNLNSMPKTSKMCKKCSKTFAFNGYKTDPNGIRWYLDDTETGFSSEKNNLCLDCKNKNNF